MDFIPELTVKSLGKKMSASILLYPTGWPYRFTLAISTILFPPF